MDFIFRNGILWAILAIAFWGIVFYRGLRSMKDLSKPDGVVIHSGIGKAYHREKDLLDDFGLTMVFGALGTVSLVLLALSVFVDVMEYIQK